MDGMGWDWIGLDWLFYTAVTPRASLQSDANNMHLPLMLTADFLG